MPTTQVIGDRAARPVDDDRVDRPIVDHRLAIVMVAGDPPCGATSAVHPPGVDLASVLRDQDGVVTTAQAQACGVSARTVRRRVASGLWRSPHPRVHLADGHRFGPAARVRAAWLWAGPSALVSGPAAAYWHGLLDAPPQDVGITVPRSSGLAGRAGIRVRRRDVAPEDRSESDRLGLTARPLTVLETAAALDDGAAFLDRALQRHVGFDSAHAAYCRMLGSTGAARAGRLLTAAADRSAAVSERRLVRLLRAAAITGWVLNYEAGPYTLDLAFPDRRVAVEFDGWAWHTDPERFRRDRRKGNDLVTSGWVLLRVTWHDLDSAPGRVVAQIRHALRPRG